MKVIKNSEISAIYFKQMLALDKATFIDENVSLPASYIESLYSKSKEGLFFILENNEVIGYLTTIFISQENFDDYLKSKDFKTLKNIGLSKSNILYLYTINIKEEYRKTKAIKLLVYNFALWLIGLKEKGHLIEKAYAEAVSLDGARSLIKGFEMEAMDDVGEDGLGHYISKDGLLSYANKIIKKGSID